MVKQLNRGRNAPESVNTLFPVVAALDRDKLAEAAPERRFGNVVGAVRKMTRRHTKNVLRFHPEFFSDKEAAGRHFDTTARTHAHQILSGLPAEGKEAVKEALRAVDSPGVPVEEKGPRFTAMLQSHPNFSRWSTAASLAAFLFGAAMVAKPRTAEAEWSAAQQVTFDPSFDGSSSLEIEDGYGLTSGGDTDDVYFCLENGNPWNWLCETVPELDETTLIESGVAVLGGYLYVTVYDGIDGWFMKYPWNGSEITGAGIELPVPGNKYPSQLTANEFLGVLVYTASTNGKLYLLDPDDPSNPLYIPVLSANAVIQEWPEGNDDPTLSQGNILQDMEGATLSEDGQTLYFAQTCASPHGGMTCPSGIKIFKATWDDVNGVFKSEPLFDANLNPGTGSALNMDPAFSLDNAKISLTTTAGTGGTYLSVLVTTTTTTTTSTGETTTTTTTTTITIPTTTTSTSTTSPSTTTTAPTVTTTTTTMTTTTTSTGHTTTTMTTTSVPTTSSTTTTTGDQPDDDDTVPPDDDDDDADDDSQPSGDDDDDGGGGSSGGCV